MLGLQKHRAVLHCAAGFLSFPTLEASVYPTGLTPPGRPTLSHRNWGDKITQPVTPREHKPTG